MSARWFSEIWTWDSTPRTWLPFISSILSIVNIFGVKPRAMVQNVFTFSKMSALAGLVLLGCSLGGMPSTGGEFHGHFWPNAGLGTIMQSRSA